MRQNNLFPDTPKPPVERVAFTMEEAGESIGVCVRTIKNYIDDGKLRAVKIGHRTVRILASDLNAFLAGLPAAGAGDVAQGDDGGVES